MKAQMFLVTMVFLAGLIFSVQTLLFQYTFLDLSEPLQKNDLYILENVKDMVNESLRTIECPDAEKNLEELNSFLTKLTIQGLSLEMTYNGESFEACKEYGCLRCENWGTADPVLDLTVYIVGTETDTKGTYYFYKLGVCGNGVVESGEDCEGENLGGLTPEFGCEVLGYTGGILACSPEDCTYDTSGCM